MNELDEIRAMFVALRSQADAGIRAVTALMARMEDEAEEPEKAPPRTFGGKPTPKENKDG